MSIRGPGAAEAMHIGSQWMPFSQSLHIKQLKYLQISQALKANKDCNLWTCSKDKIQLVFTNQTIFKNPYS